MAATAAGRSTRCHGRWMFGGAAGAVGWRRSVRSVRAHALRRVSLHALQIAAAGRTKTMAGAEPAGDAPCKPMRRQMRAAFSIALALLLSACQTWSPDGGMSVVADIAGRDLNKHVVALRTPEEAQSVRARVVALLRRPLTADAAVQVALINNRALQAAYNELGLAEAAMIQTSLPPNPTLSVSRVATSLEIEIERKIVADILALATLPARSDIAADRFW